MRHKSFSEFLCGVNLLGQTPEVIRINGCRRIGNCKPEGTMKNRSKTLLAILATGLLSCALFSQQTQAAPITGTIQLGGAVRFNTNSLATATRINIWFDDNNNPGHSTVDPGSTGTFASIPVGSQATMAQPWIFAPSTPTPALWSVGGFTFDLTSSVVTFRSASSLTVEGMGIVSGNGFDPTEMEWAFTTQSAGGRTHLVFSYSANGSSGAVPDGGSAVGLLGLALTGVEVLRRKLRIG